MGRGVARHPGGRRAQATIEFAFVAPLFLLCFLASIDAALWAVQSSASVSAAEQAARLAAAAAGTPQSEQTPSAAVLFGAVRTQLAQAMFGTAVVAWCDPAAPTCAVTSTFARCPTSPAEVEQRFGARTVAICDETSTPATACPAPPAPPIPRCGDPPTVTVRVIGFLASLVPPLDSLGWRGGEIPVDIVATTHALRFAT